MAALGLQRVRGALRDLFDALVYVALMIPGIVIGIATLVALGDRCSTLLNPLLAALWPAVLGAPPQLQLGPGLADRRPHAVHHGAGGPDRARRGWPAWTARWSRPRWISTPRPGRTFRQITLPQLLPAIVASLLLAFTFSFDDFVIAFFVAGANTTLPIYVFSSIRRGVTPEINAIGTMVLAVSLI